MLTCNGSKSFQKFIKGVTDLMENGLFEEEIVCGIEKLLEELLEKKTWLPLDKQKANLTQYARHLLYEDPLKRFEVLALVWKDGQSTPLHDHDGTWGVEGVFSGRIMVQNFIQTKQLGNSLVYLTHTGNLYLGEGETDKVIPPADCHILEISKNESVITIHVYGKRLEKFKVYIPTEEKNVYMCETKYISYNS
ncbi:TPA: cysteine dioxygenase family protein [Bacillus thuringiensis]|jgi:predicted metal-dependent enzyme (double-stranded beta helix superfamily)|uniref:Cysteine dioxygenase n=13 Tax=Bacillus cereus group TaxID=86661 RepID=A0A9X8TGI1_BACCE|nr:MULTISPECIES: cysteine dioxygenase family protein [Bacillus]ANN32611.1 cysteine dioxygenase [Bacillus thuringiensis serovar coreanensis]MCO4216337.1 cysteine dioxygenase family protein [Bacillus sp. 10017]MCU7389892.1 cysteine dioxygenase family protein [Bacillus sp. ST24]MCX2703071.1 cysteine dioxygenase family protein [Bacillus sp. AS_5]NIE93336.1 cysteine dioxygenase [Bacillus sp. Ab-1751]QQP82114.1 cysteine dioxygenase family protein [Bacillus sp. TK-2]COQ59950.1 Predicted metal-depen